MKLQTLQHIVANYPSNALLVKLGDEVYPFEELDISMVENHGIVELNLGAPEQPCTQLAQTKIGSAIENAIEISATAINDTLPENIEVTAWHESGDRHSLSDEFKIIDDSVLVIEKPLNTNIISDALSIDS